MKQDALENFDVEPVVVAGIGTIDRIFVPKGASQAERDYWLDKRIAELQAEGVINTPS